MKRVVFRSPWAACLSGALLMGLAQLLGQCVVGVSYGASEENEAHPRGLLRRQRVDPSRSAAEVREAMEVDVVGHEAQVEQARVALSPRPIPSSPPAVGSFSPRPKPSSSPAAGSATPLRSLEQLPPPSAKPPGRPPIKPAASPPSSPPSNPASKPAAKPAAKVTVTAKRRAAAAAAAARAAAATAAKAAAASPGDPAAVN